MLRLVVLSTMIQEVLQNCHDSLEGGHQGIAWTFYRVKLDYYMVGLYADVARHVRSCRDCSSSKSRPTIGGYSPGNILAERPFQVVSMDFVIPLPKARWSNTTLLLFQCAFTGYVMGKVMADTTALRVAQAFEECVYRRFSGALSLIRHDRDPRFMSESDALAWRREVNRQQEIALKMAKEYQATEKSWRARKHNESLRGRERCTPPETGRTVTPSDEQPATGAVTEDSDSNATGATRSLFEVGSRVWLYMERVKPGLTKKLAHRWHGPFRVKMKVEEFAYELELLPIEAGTNFTR
ncbi:hypothetical protein PHMEG_00027667 [Phytophthora megakarya]|uniref:Integrase catalytic domain-containing protein n=1 Tax=Phytophthora megakarya TaxID=4795 RepID=A0A225V7C8_9STRA|nr:hypothetical protein PHMEG_00027667 [Phytophthora megakarya]